MARYVPIGQPTNQAEEDAFRDLRDTLPDHFVVIGNFELSFPRRANTFEYDAVLIGEYGLYAVEIKGWSGTITGDLRRWGLQWGRVENPFIRTEQKAKALRHLLVTSIDDFPDELYCQSVVYFPRDVQLDIDEPRVERALGPAEIYDFFVDRSEIEAYGPGPLLDEALRTQILDCLTPLARPRTRQVVVPGYEIEAELEIGEAPYREFVGKHHLLRSRSKARIKAYSMDPLLPHHQREREYTRVLRDMEALSQLEDNPYVARPYDLIQDREDDLIFFLVSEWVGPSTLGEHIEQTRDDIVDHGAPREHFRFAEHLLRAAGFMHERGIVHRNLNPSVIYMTGRDGNVPLKIADFDYARISHLPSIAGHFDSLGTEGYIAPEMWQGDDYDSRVDLFAIGAILYELFTGLKLFDSLQSLTRPKEAWADRQHAIESSRCREILGGLLAADPDDRTEDLTPAIEYFAQAAEKSLEGG